MTDEPRTPSTGDAAQGATKTLGTQRLNGVLGYSELTAEHKHQHASISAVRLTNQLKPLATATCHLSN